MKKVLLAIDSSPHSRRAAQYVAEVVPHVSGAEVVVFSAVAGLPPDAALDPGVSLPREHELHGDEDCRDELLPLHNLIGEIRDLFARKGLSSERIEICCQPVRHGIAQDILDAARECNCDTVAVGSRHLSKVMSLLQGSVSTDLVHRAHALTLWVVA